MGSQFKAGRVALILGPDPGSFSPILLSPAGGQPAWLVRLGCTTGSGLWIQGSQVQGALRIFTDVQFCRSQLCNQHYLNRSLSISAGTRLAPIWAGSGVGGDTGWLGGREVRPFSSRGHCSALSVMDLSFVSVPGVGLDYTGGARMPGFFGRGVESEGQS